MKLDEIIIGLAIKIHYLKIADIRIGFLINFNEILLKDGLKRLANKYNDNE